MLPFVMTVLATTRMQLAILKAEVATWLVYMGSQMATGVRLTHSAQRGAGLQGPIFLLIIGMVAFVVGLRLSLVAIDTAGDVGADATVPSFSGVRQFNDLMPLLFQIGLIVIGLGLMLGGGYGAYKTYKK